MINSVVKPSTQGQAAVNNIPYTDIRVMEEMDFHAFGNFNKPKSFLYRIKTDYWWNGLSLYIVKQGFHYKWGNENA